ncbi:MAG: tetratricopeptide repeat protein [Candidatus Binatia bacterium]
MSERPSGFAIVAPVLVVLLAVAFSMHRLEDFDTWFHLAAGRLMLASGTWPAANTFSLTAPDYPWVDLHWIFQLVLYAAWTLAGVNGVIVLAAMLTATTALVLYGVARRFVPPMLAAFLVAVALTISSPRFVPRPELLSFLYFAVYLALLEGYPRNGRAIFLLIPLQILWANTQGIFAVGLALGGCYWLGATLAFLPVPRGWRETCGLDFVAWRRLTVVLAVATLGCLANPWGLEGALFPFQLLPRVTGNSLFSARIGEFRPPLESGYAPVLVKTWLTVLIASGLSFLVSIQRWHLGRLLAGLAFGVLSTQSLRNMAFFGWMAVPVLAGNLGPLVARWRVPAWLRGGIATVTAMAIVLLVASIATNRFSYVMNVQREFGLGVSRVRFPEGAVAFLERAGISGRAFNCLAMGGYLTWSRPHDAVFVDGRLEAFPEAIFRDYFQAMDEPGTFPRATRPYALDYALLYHAWGNRMPLVNYLAKDHGWTLVYFDEIAAVFVPSDEAHRAMRERATATFAEMRAERAREPEIELPTLFGHALSLPVGDVWRLRSYGNLLKTFGYADEAVTAYKRSLALDPDQTEARFSLGLAYWALNQREGAIREWREVLRRDPTDERVKQVLGRATGAR